MAAVTTDTEPWEKAPRPRLPRAPTEPRARYLFLLLRRLARRAGLLGCGHGRLSRAPAASGAGAIRPRAWRGRTAMGAGDPALVHASVRARRPGGWGGRGRRGCQERGAARRGFSS